MKHEYSTIILLGLIAIFGLTFLVSAISSEEVDILCDTDNSMLVRINGEWQCSGDLNLEDDLRFPVTQIKTQGASNIPEYKSFIPNTYSLAFDSTTLEQGYITMQLP